MGTEGGTVGSDLVFDVVGRVAVVTMNRPSRLNATSPIMMDAFADALAAVRASSEIGALVLTGAGDAFCAGGDVNAMNSEPSLDERVSVQRRRHALVTLALWRLPIPTIAAIPGPVAGAGLSFALTCDLRYAVPSAVFTTAFARVALSGDHGISWLLTRAVGTSRARELLFLSERIDATEAARIGLITKVLEQDTFMTDVMGRAVELANGPRSAIRRMKQALNVALRGDLEEVLELEAENQSVSFTTVEHQEAVRAFLERGVRDSRGSTDRVDVDSRKVSS